MATVACEPAGDMGGLPEGDRERGATLFSESVNGAPACSDCHTLDGTALVGPSFLGFGERASTRESERGSIAYTYTSIVSPGEHVVEGFNNAMYSQYEQRLSTQQIADLIAYLLEQ